jgi:hypothetical protein
MKKRFNEEQIIRSLKEHVAGKKLQILFGNIIFPNKYFTVEKINTAGRMLAKQNI